MTIGRMVVAAVLLVVGSTVDARACSCLETSRPGRPGIGELSKYEFVVLGQIVNLQEVEEAREAAPSVTMVEATIRIRKAWKGPNKTLTLVRTKASGGSCGYPFKLGETYVIYARGTSEPFFAHLCDPTKLAEGAGEEIAALDKLLVPKHGSPSN